MAELILIPMVECVTLPTSSNACQMLIPLLFGTPSSAYMMMTSHLSLVTTILRPFPQLWPYYNTTEFIKTLKSESETR